MTVRAIVLAAGKGTRMKSARPKVLHELCGRAMLWYVVRALRDAGIGDVIVVTSVDLEKAIGEFDVRSVVQNEQLGTGHAVGVALRALEERGDGRVVVAYGDMPLLHAEIFHQLLAALERQDETALAMVTARMPLPSNFGRVVRRNGDVLRVVEVKDATPDELAIDEMNCGIYAFAEDALRAAVSRLNNANAQREYYLTDTVEDLARSHKRVVPVRVEDHTHTLGINDRAELALARRQMNARLCEHYMREGATIIDPAATYLEPELRIGADTVIYPNSTIGRLSEMGEGCTIGPNARLSNAKLGDRVTVRESVIVDCTVDSNVTIGPFAHLRDESVLAQEVRIGNFVEVKRSQLARGVKASHLSYIGDATVGEESNIGAGTITCNYDGERKHETTIGKNVRIGSNTSIVAPRTIGDGAMTGASSVVTKDIPAGERVAGNPARPLPKKP